jgi:hypothetical protein
MTELRAESPESLGQINDALHDRWFDVEDVEFNKPARHVRLRFRDSAKAALNNLILDIGNVDELLLTETEGIGVYDFNRLTFLAPSGTLRVKTGVPLRFEMRVSRVDVTVRDATEPARR